MIYNLLLSIFVITIFLCFLTYLLYPLLIAILSKLRPLHISKNKNYLPKISIIISAYNEEKHILSKIKNTLEIDYPKDLYEILIGSDGSTDNTAKIVNELNNNNVRFFDFTTNRGKTSVQNDLVESSTGEIIVFTDAASFLPKDSIKELIYNFSDHNVGCVAGRMVFVSTDSNLNTKSQGLYWKYEVQIRIMESKLGSLIGVDGPLYAIRRDYYVPLKANIISDLITPLLVLGQNKRVILEQHSIIEEEPTQQSEQEFKTRRRITLRGLVGIFSHPTLINPFKHPLLSAQIFCHKIIRWFVGPIVILNFFCCVLLFIYYNNIFFSAILTAYLLLFISASIGWLIRKNKEKNKLFAIPYYFLLVNTAATFGIFDFITKKQAVTWETQRD
ncbi:MAG: glycosyltransferase family 2 protein [Candidatus Thiodiazotropha weberae]|nr:glycosyltransferase family 2 protein [Candidatus Thiodiazotropha lotti]MCG8011907.1 glycosyltransferase family 2 protein [Candidatus Thiodiazotropha lotti]MCG8021626.1 glycosyltransferase family 2 protein [Candidatus Thiodiazotropha lotti]MCW4208795.1 glycosyltransferase family 2 protein [Candidatus Thiodiazotropha lotti]MCW4211374.1 glycosyltransferase family 2 protein [Candidatus Thiodiazotropha lotti]